MTSAVQRQIAEAVKSEIYQDFSMRHLSGNLMNSIEMIFNEDDVQIRIPAVRYDLNEWNKNKAIIHHPEWGSYANQVDISGGFSATHQNYADRAITKAIMMTLGSNNTDYDVEVY